MLVFFVGVGLVLLLLLLWFVVVSNSAGVLTVTTGGETNLVSKQVLIMVKDAMGVAGGWWGCCPKQEICGAVLETPFVATIGICGEYIKETIHITQMYHSNILQIRQYMRIDEGVTRVDAILCLPGGCKMMWFGGYNASFG